MIKDKRMKPCPKCGSRNVYTNWIRTASGTRDYCACLDCGYTQGLFLTQEQAIEKWNKEQSTLEKYINSIQ